jgi:hypothetical protein
MNTMARWWCMNAFVVVATGIAAAGGSSDTASSSIALKAETSFGRTSHVGHVADGTPLAKFQVDLDAPPRLRWAGVMKANRAAARRTMTSLFAKLPARVHAEVDKLVVEANTRLPKWAREEMRGIADVLNVTLADVVGLYEWNAAAHERLKAPRGFQPLRL